MIRVKDLWGIVIPILIGGILYYLFEPSVIFVKIIVKYTKLRVHIDIDNMIYTIIRNYIFDILWSISLVNTVWLFIKRKKSVIIITSIFVIIMETIQISPYIKGTFDIFDIIIELIFIYFILKRNVVESYEK